jgi:hypothetical protein
MIENLRKTYNANFTDKKYKSFLDFVDKEYGHPVDFRVSETPVFIPNEFKDKLKKGVEEIVDVITREDFKKLTDRAIPQHQNVPNEDAHSQFLVIDFGVCEDDDGNITPQMIEMQGFPSLFFFQHLLAVGYRKIFDLPENFTHLFNGHDENSYIEAFRRIIVENSNPKNVVLLEVEPEKQGTQIDFWGTEKYLGIKILCLTNVRQDGSELWYEDENHKKVTIERIYNRVIFDELDRKSHLKFDFNLTSPIDAKWIGHPNWFFRISKYTLPFIKSEFVPETHFLNELTSYPEDLSKYVLKPLFSFSGQGVKINITNEDLDAVETDRENFILQKKVNYKPVLHAPGESVKVEIRMLLIWPEEDARPTVISNLIRLSKGEMVGVRYNKDKDWVGASIGFFEKE